MIRVLLDEKSSHRFFIKFSLLHYDEVTEFFILSATICSPLSPITFNPRAMEGFQAHILLYTRLARSQVDKQLQEF